MSTIRLARYATMLLLILSSCEKNEETSLQRTDRLLKSVTWKLDKLTIDDIEEPLLYSGMTIVFSKDIYTSDNAEPVWPLLGLWTLENETTLVRDDGIAVNIQSIEPSRLVLMLQWNKTTFGGRGNSVTGMHVFELIPK